MKKTLTFLSSLLLLGGCAPAAISTQPKPGEITAVTDLTSENKKNGNTVFRLETEFRNQSENLSLMEIRYTVRAEDAAGNEIFTVHDTWNGQDTPLDPHQTAIASYAFQQETKDDVKNVIVTVDSWQTSDELPPVHLPQPGEYLYEVHKSEYIRNMKKELPVQVYIIIDHMGAQEIADITDPETIQAVTDAFTDLTIAEETNEWVTDNYNSVTFTFADGTSVFISLNLTNLEYSVYGHEHMYELGNFAEFWTLINDLAEFPQNS